MKRPDRHDNKTPRHVRPSDFYSAPKDTHCRTCRTTTWTALHDAQTIHLAPEPLNQLGELSALITGRKTYLRLMDRLIRRTAHAITDKPTPNFGTIHAPHTCHQPPNPQHLTTPTEKDLGGLFEPPCPF